MGDYEANISVETIDTLNSGCGKNCFTKPAATMPTSVPLASDMGGCYVSSDIPGLEGGSGLLPWSWIIRPGFDEAVQGCPDVAETIGMFVFVNVIAACAATLFGNTSIKRFLTCGFCTKENLFVAWLLSVALGLLSNLAVVYLIKLTPGYEFGFNVWELWLFYSTRPRLGWVVSVTLSGVHSKHNRSQLYEEWQKSYYWRSSANAAILAECLWQLLAVYYMVKTMVWGITNSLYDSGVDKYQLDSSTTAAVRVMYIGALLWVIMRIPFNVLLIMVYTGSRRLAGSDLPARNALALLLPCIWVPQWLFFGGFIVVAKNA